jgi:hypothetical protein
VRRHGASYHEELLHWIWKSRNFESRQLQTTAGDPITVYQPGNPNQSDGPDFAGAHLQVGILQWHGDIEIHWKCSDWSAHGHGQDPRYNNVILHVVFQETTKQSIREDGTAIPTLCLKPYLSDPLETFLEEYLAHPQLPCSKHLAYISEQAFAKQLEKAHREYFEQKVDDLSIFYDPDLVPSQAWVKLLAKGFFDGLGISHNREPMRRLCDLLLEQMDGINAAAECREQALLLAGLNEEPPSTEWKHKGCRPANQPRIRVQQAALGLWAIAHLPFDQWMRQDPEKLWQNIIMSVTMTPSIGTERSSILFGTVFLPALYTLGNIFHHQSLKEAAWELWHSHQVSLPKSLLRPLRKTDLTPSLYNQKLGTIHQLRHYCREGACQKCLVFKDEFFS